MTIRETPLTKRILKALNQLPGCRALKKHGTAFGRRGEPDIYGCYQGRAFFLEVKVPGEEPTDLQRVALRRWGETGAISTWVTSVEDALAAVRGRAA